jgi:SAM-dependent methyltransferase
VGRDFIRVNVGCGQTPTSGWRNLDNSPSLRFARLRFVPWVLRRAGLIDDRQHEFMQSAQKHNIEYCDAIQRLPFPDAQVSIVYSSHMLEHLDRVDAQRFLREAFRVLSPGGAIRLAVPDLKRQAERYLEHGDADAFVAGSLMAVPRPRSLRTRMAQLTVGPRHHLWMYDGPSLCRLLETLGFERCDVVPPGETRLSNIGELNLRERQGESVYVEGFKP